MKPGYIRPLSSSELIDLPFGLLRDLGWRGVWLHALGLLPWLVVTAVLLAPLATVLPTNMRMFGRLELGMVGEVAWWRWLLWFFSAVLLGFPLAAGTWRTAWHILGVQKNVRQCYAETWRAALQLMPVVLVLQLTLWIGNLFNILPGIGSMFALFAIYPFYIGWSFASPARLHCGAAGGCAVRSARGTPGTWRCKGCCWRSWPRYRASSRCLLESFLSRWVRTRSFSPSTS
jgi:hypothetical protein